MSGLTVVVMVIALGAMASSALVVARYVPSNPISRKLTAGIYVVLAVVGLAKAISEVRTDLGTAAFFIAMSAFFCVLAWVAFKGPRAEGAAK